MEQPRQMPWLEWSRRLQAIAQNGLTYARDAHDAGRYAAVREVAAEMIATGSGGGISPVRDLLGKDTGYATPKVDVRGVVFDNEKMLLVREQSDGRWALPGGWADVGESPAGGVVREIHEESGYKTRCKKLLAVFDRSKHPHDPPFLFHVWKLFFLCEIAGGAPATSSETVQVAFFGESEIPELSITRVTPWQIKRMFEHLRNPDMPADFD